MMGYFGPKWSEVWGQNAVHVSCSTVFLQTRRLLTPLLFVVNKTTACGILVSPSNELAVLIHKWVALLFILSEAGRASGFGD